MPRAVLTSAAEATGQTADTSALASMINRMDAVSLLTTVISHGATRSRTEGADQRKVTS
jgi:hypothetical protein